MDVVKVNVETGKKKVFVSAQDWPGWSRSGKDETSALENFFGYGPRYAEALQTVEISFAMPMDITQINIEERLPGNATTDFGAPAIVFQSDKEPIVQADYERFISILQASWRKFDTAVQAAEGKKLKKGSRGGGRDLEKMINHVIDADAAYFPRIAWKFKRQPFESWISEIEDVRKEIWIAIEKAREEGLPEKGPRGGVIWPIRYYIRRVVWHILDHAWEIEDRIVG